jgi:hypothetical protein
MIVHTHARTREQRFADRSCSPVKLLFFGVQDAETTFARTLDFERRWLSAKCVVCAMFLCHFDSLWVLLCRWGSFEVLLGHWVFLGGVSGVGCSNRAG